MTLGDGPGVKPGSGSMLEQEYRYALDDELKDDLDDEMDEKKEQKEEGESDEVESKEEEVVS